MAACGLGAKAINHLIIGPTIKILFQIFQALENPYEKETLDDWLGIFLTKRKLFLNAIRNETSSPLVLEEALTEYEEVVEQVGQAVKCTVHKTGYCFCRRWTTE